jgi:hypothetical protein
VMASVGTIRATVTMTLTAIQMIILGLRTGSLNPASSRLNHLNCIPLRVAVEASAIHDGLFANIGPIQGKITIFVKHLNTAG